MSWLACTYVGEVAPDVYGARAVDERHQVDEARHDLERRHCLLHVVGVNAGQAEVEDRQQVRAALGKPAVVAQHGARHGGQAVEAGDQPVRFRQRLQRRVRPATSRNTLRHITTHTHHDTCVHALYLA